MTTCTRCLVSLRSRALAGPTRSTCWTTQTASLPWTGECERELSHWVKTPLWNPAAHRAVWIGKRRCLIYVGRGRLVFPGRRTSRMTCGPTRSSASAAFPSPKGRQLRPRGTRISSRESYSACCVFNELASMIDRVGLSYGGWRICAVRLSLTIYPPIVPSQRAAGVDEKRGHRSQVQLHPCSSEGGL